MEIGVRIPGAGPKATPDNIVTAARWAEELGYHSVWVSDHVVLPEPEQVTSRFPYDAAHRWRFPADTTWFDPLLALSLASAVAPSVKLGTSILVLPLRNPVLLAKQIASLDCLSNGRVILGVGAGWMREEFALIGVPFAQRGARAAEMMTLMRALWRGQAVDFSGAFYQVAGGTMYPRPVQSHLPVVWGGHSDRTLERVVQLGDGWHPTQSTLEQLAQGITRLRRLCALHDRDPDTLPIIARPGPIYAIDAQTHARHCELGIAQVIVDPPLDGPGLERFRDELERVAHVCGLKRRTA